MARTRFVLQPEAEVALAAAGTAKTVLQLVTPANIGVAVKGFGVCFDGVSGGAEPLLVELLTQTTAGTMTAQTPRHDDTRIDGVLTIQSSGQKNATAEPTAGTIRRQWDIHPQAGVEFRWVFDEEIVIGGATAQRLGVRVTVPTGGTAVNCIPALYCEE